MSTVPQQGIPIEVKFVTEIRDGLKKENVAFETNGLYYLKGNHTYLSFEEPEEVGHAKTTVKIAKDEVLILRSGSVKMRQVFRKKETTIGSYQNQLGSFQLMTKTNNVEYKWFDSSKKGSLFLTYELTLQGEHSGRYAIHMQFKMI